MVQWKQQYTLKAGTRHARRSKWMWELEYYEHMGQIAQGSVPRKTAAKQWQEMMNDPAIRKTDDGPNGAARIKICLGDYESSFSEEAEEDQVEVHVASKKKASRSDVANMVDQ
eukprot:4606948-Pyramimonas_sp.AAC.1